MNFENTFHAARMVLRIDKSPAHFYTPRGMVNLDRLHWFHFFAFTLYGARIGIRSNESLGLTELEQGLPPHWKVYTRPNVDWQYSLLLSPPTRSGRKPFHTLYSNNELYARSRDLNVLVEAFERDVQLAVAQKARGRVFVHAGVVGWQGKAIVIPGKSYSGKSTLVRELVRAGATYYSDEYAVLDNQGNVYPFARQLTLRDERQVNQKLPFADLGGKIGKRPIPVGTVLVAKYGGNTRWRPRTLSPGLGSLELLANTVMARSGKPIVLQAITRVAANSVILKGSRGEARPFVERLLRSLA